MFSDWGELVFRFIFGGIIVTAFAVLAEIFRPKSFAGLFGAAPSIALATMGITIAQHEKAYAGMEARSLCAQRRAGLLDLGRGHHDWTIRTGWPD